MTILLLGYGKMGRAIEHLALARGHQIAGRINIDNQTDLYALSDADVDVVIEFSSPESAVANIRYCLEMGWPVVCGTTGWLEQRDAIEQLCHAKKGAFFFASNYSIGVNLFFRLNKTLARLMRNEPSYQVSMTEIHHTEKKDAPSGTAITLAEGILAELPGTNRWISQEAGATNSDVVEAGGLVIESLRKGAVPGTHTVRYDSAVDQIEITHTAHSRNGFALGALTAAEWLVGREGVFGMDDLLSE